MITELLVARFIIKKWLPTNGPTDQPTDGPTYCLIDQPTDGLTDGQTLLQRCVDASKVSSEVSVVNIETENKCRKKVHRRGIKIYDK